MASELIHNVADDGTESWTFRWYTPAGRRQQYTGTDEAFVATMRLKIRDLDGNILARDARVKDGSLVTGKGRTQAVTFEDACRAMIEASGGDDDTQHRYTRVLETHLRPLMRLPIDSVEPEDLRDLIRSLASECIVKGRRRAGLAGSTLSTGPWAVIAATFAFESARSGSRRNPAVAVRKSLRKYMNRKRQNIDKFLSHDEWAELAPIAGSDPVLAMFMEVALGTGGRWGEIAALRVSDLRLGDEPTVTFQRTLAQDRETGALKLKECKAKSERTIVISEALADSLRRWVVGKSAGATLFPATRGVEHMRYDKFYTHHWKPFVERAQEAGFTKPMTIHMLRHTYGSWLLAETRDIFLVSKMLGHKSIRTTSDIYMHLLPVGDKRTRKSLKKVEGEVRAAQDRARRRTMHAV